MGLGMWRRRRALDERGSPMVLVALCAPMLMGFAAVAIDVGRSTPSGATSRTRRRGRPRRRQRDDPGAPPPTPSWRHAVLTANFVNDPTGNPADALRVPIYAPGHAGEEHTFATGILVSSGEVRVALRNPVDYTSARPHLPPGIGARPGQLSRGLLPIAVRRYIHAAWSDRRQSTVRRQPERVHGLLLHGQYGLPWDGHDGSLRTAPSTGRRSTPRTRDDPTNHGPVVTILGQGAQPSNVADFRGFVVLDIRTSPPTPRASTTTASRAVHEQTTLKSFEAAWIEKGCYPGPDLPPISARRTPMNQVGVLNGNSSGIAVDAVTS